MTWVDPRRRFRILFPTIAKIVIAWGFIFTVNRATAQDFNEASPRLPLGLSRSEAHAEALSRPLETFDKDLRSRPLPRMVDDSNSAIRPLTETLSMNLTPRELSLREAIRIAMSESTVVRTLGSAGVQIEAATAYDPLINKARADASATVFDPRVTAGYLGSRINEPPGTFFGPGITQNVRRDEGDFTASLSKSWATGATTSIGYLPPLGYLFYPNGNPGQYNPVYTSDLVAQVTQPLLRGAGTEVNTAPIRIAQLRAEQSTWDCKQAALAQVRSVETAYWELQASLITVDAMEAVLPLMSEIVRIEEHRAEAELSTAADVARSTMQFDQLQQQRIQSRNDAVAKELRLRNLLSLDFADGTRIVPIDLPKGSAVPLDLATVVDNATQFRPDLVRMRLGVRIRELEYAVSKNGLKPQLDLQALYRSNGIGQGLNTSLQQMAGFAYSDVTVGATFSIPLGNRAAKANLQATQFQLSRDRAVLHQTIQNLHFSMADQIREITTSFSQYELALRRVRNSREWIRAARLRYSNPPTSDDGHHNWLLLALYDYQNALKMNVEATTDAGQLLARYNTQLAKLEEAQGTLLTSRGIDFRDDPCATVQENSEKLFGPRQSTELPIYRTRDAEASSRKATWPSGSESTASNGDTATGHSTGTRQNQMALGTRPTNHAVVRATDPSAGHSVNREWDEEDDIIRPANYSSVNVKKSQSTAPASTRSE